MPGRGNAVQEETAEREVYTIETIPAEVTSEQIEFFRKVLQQRPELLTQKERETVEKQDGQIVAAREIHEIYQTVNERGYSTYEKGLPSFDVTNNLLVYGKCSELYRQIDQVFETMFPNHWLRIQYENYRYEARNLAAFCITKNYNIASLEAAGLYLHEYCDYLKNNGYREEKSYRLLCEFFSHIPLQQQAA